jgi:hypothetical protein
MDDKRAITGKVVYFKAGLWRRRFVVFLLIGGYFCFVTQEEYIKIAESQTLSTDPLNAAYVIGDEEVTLIGGREEREAASGSATMIITSVFGEPVYNDLDHDGDDDAALLLAHDPGGSGTFYYLAAAVNIGGAYKGTNALLIGDRIAPKTTQISNGILIHNYADRLPGEPMSARPSVGKSKYAVLRGERLEEIAPLEKGEQVLEGYVTIGHEVRAFRPCKEHMAEYWLSGRSPGLRELMSKYEAATSGAKPYTPLFAVVVGKITDAPTDGFGAAYDNALEVSRLVSTWLRGNCKSDLIVVQWPLPGFVITSPLRVEGRARGRWYFEGDFPIILVDADGKIIAERFAKAQGEWMTESFVPFKGTLEFEEPGYNNGLSNRGTLIFKKDNPSDFPELDDELEVPVYFE